jgi:class 3 adenylate cyclase
VTTSCPTCCAETPDGARFCPACGAALAVGAALATERKVVTTLFADLVGFTALGERHDPEDVDRALRDYYALARTIIERFGGVVEKFIGDAVVGLFGVPKAHEDDAERATRAALEIVAHMIELPRIGSECLQVRCAVNTGTAFVRLHARPEAGEGVLVGDAVNTAARLLSDAPAMGVVVGEATQRLSSRAIAYEAMAPQIAKGKFAPVARWLARGPIARRGVDLRRAYGAPLVGREVEIGILKGLFAQACASARPRLALIEGEAGVGKTRLVVELARWIDHEPGLIATWRQSRCLPYGEGSGFQPLADVVRLHCGIADGDDDSAIVEKLDRALGDTPEHDWISDRLRALLGLAAPPAEQDENFSAWARFLDLVAQEHPAVIFFDDLHWADEALLDFLGHLLGDGCTTPLLLIGAARPELLEQHPEIARYLGAAATGEDTPATRIDLASLSRHETERLVAELSPDVAADVTTVIVDRSGGNPFYAEELVRLLRDHRHGEVLESPGFDSLPDSLQALLTARLDALEADHKSMLGDAAVAGQEFSVDLVAAMGDRDPGDVLAMLAELNRREFVRPAPDRGPVGDSHFVFWHAMTRDAAYSELPRGARAGKHLAAARWLETRMSDGPDDPVTALAHHYVTAFDLLTEMGDESAAVALRQPAVAALARAGDAALPLDVRAAHDHYARGRSLAQKDDALRPRLILALAESSIRLGDLDAATQQLQSGIAELRAAGDRRAAAVALTRLSNVVYWRELGGVDTASHLRDQALELLQGDEPSPELVTVLEERAVQCSRDLEPQASVAFADEAIAMSERLGLPLPVRALAYRGAARCDAGDTGGLDDLRRARAMAVQRGEALVADSAAQIIADCVYAAEGPAAGLSIAREALSDAARRGEHLAETWFRMQVVQFHRLSGRWGEALDEALPLEARLEERESLSPLHDLRWDIAQIRLHQGDLVVAQRLLDWCLLQFSFHPFTRLQDLGAKIALASRLEDWRSAREALTEYEELGRNRRRSVPVAMTLAQVVRAAVRCDASDVGRSIVADLTRPRLLERAAVSTFHGLLAEQDGDLAGAERTLAAAALAWHEFGDPLEESLAMADRGRCLLALDRPADAVIHLKGARETLARLGARPALAEADQLLTRCGAPARVLPPSSASGPGHL